MAGFERYNVSVRYYNKVEGKNRMQIAERVIQTYDNLDQAIDKMIDLCIQSRPYDTFVDADYVKYEIRNTDVWEEFDAGEEYRILFDEMHDCHIGKYYVGPGAYVLQKRLLQ